MKKASERLLSPRVIASAKYASGYERTIEHLKVWKLVLPETVKETEVSLPQSGKPQLGTQLFLYQHIPQMKFHNPKLKVSVYENEGSQSYLRFRLHHSSTQQLVEVETTGLTHHQIKEKLENMDWSDPT